MLLISIKADAYLKGHWINKNTLFFRDWILSRLFIAEPKEKWLHVANLKLIYWYFKNRIFGGYWKGYELAIDGSVFGLYGILNLPHDPKRALPLTPKAIAIENQAGEEVTSTEVPKIEEVTSTEVPKVETNLS